MYFLQISPYNLDISNHITNQISQLLRRTTPNPPDCAGNKGQILDPKSPSHSTSLHAFTVMSSWVFSYFKVYELWIPTNHMGLNGISFTIRKSTYIHGNVLLGI